MCAINDSHDKIKFAPKSQLLNSQRPILEVLESKSLLDLNAQGIKNKHNNKWEIFMQHILSLTRQFDALNEQCERGSNHILKLVGN